jgi:hypothetical protein
MPYAFAVSTPVVVWVNGRKHVTWKVTETGGIAPTDEWNIPGVPMPCDVKLHECELVTPGSAATIDPIMGTAATFVADTNNALPGNVTPAAHTRNQSSVRVRASSGGYGTLYGRSGPNLATGATGRIETYVTIAEGLGD